MKKVIVLHGANGVGKDAVADILRDSYGFEKMQFKDPALKSIRELLGESLYGRFWRDYNDRSTKEVGVPYLGGLSPRGLLIKYCEEFVKPTFGSDFFGRLAADAVRRSGGDRIVFSDFRFAEEVESLAEVVSANVRVVLLCRSGFNLESFDFARSLNLRVGWVHSGDGLGPEDTAREVLFASDY